MSQTAIPYYLMRGGTSKAHFFLREDLPEDMDKLAEILIAIIGSGHALNIDGVGGGSAVTTKVAVLSPSTVEGCDIDYFFAQVSVETKLVDFKPTCGNILTAVGPAAVEMGLLQAQKGETKINIHAVNTGAKVEAIIQTPDKIVSYEGSRTIAGVPGSASPIVLNFEEIVGSSTGKFLPTGDLLDVIDGVEVTCMDVAMPMVIAKASDFGLTGYESPIEIDQNKAFYERMEKIRVRAGKMMGMGNVQKSVTPKFGLLAPAKNGGTIAARYFMPWNCHPAFAVTGSQCVSVCALMEGTVAEGLAIKPAGSPAEVIIEHPMGKIEVFVNYEIQNGSFILKNAGLIRTARKIARGEVFIPSHILNG